MATAFHHGITVTESKTTSRLIATIATACIGLVVTAPASDAAAFGAGARGCSLLGG